MSEEETKLRSILGVLEGFDTAGLCLQDADFEKDQDLNFHIDFIAAASNLRAANYRIKQATRHKCKMIAGKIIPAIATTTASVTGLIMIEFLKVMQEKPLESFKNSSNSLGLNLYLLQEPNPPQKAKDEYDPVMMEEVKTFPPEFTKWNKIVIDKGKLTVQGFMDAFQAETGLTVTLLFHKVAELFDGSSKPPTNPKYQSVSGLFLYDKEAWKPELTKLYEEKKGADLQTWVQERYEVDDIEVVGESRNYIELQVSSEKDGCSYKTPTIIYKFK
jgi:ubiquitin-activating enzyme E1